MLVGGINLVNVLGNGWEVILRYDSLVKRFLVYLNFNSNFDHKM